MKADELLEGLKIGPTTYSPKLPQSGGKYVYMNAKEYNYRWLKLKKDRKPKNRTEYEPFEPAKVWIEDMWIFGRRMVGDEFCQKVFYFMCTWIWLTNDVEKGDVIRSYQGACIKNVFLYSNPKLFVRGEKESTKIESWDGRDHGFYSYDMLKKLGSQIGILGPLAAMFGRDIEQEIMFSTRGTYLLERLFRKSVESAYLLIKTANFS